MKHYNQSDLRGLKKGSSMEVYKNAVSEPVAIDHKFYGEFILTNSSDYTRMIDRLAELEACLDEN